MSSQIKFAILSTDVAILTYDGSEIKVLLTKAESGAFVGMPSLPGGLVGPEEEIKLGARRIVAEVLHLKNYYIEQLATFGDPDRDPIGRVVSVAYMVLVPWNKAKLALGKGAEWVVVKKVPKMAYDHNKILKTAMTRLAGKMTYTNIVYGLMAEEFTLTELQRVYENILGKELDKRNFRKKVFAQKMLIKLNKRKEGSANRPAQLYGFKVKSLQEVEIV